MKIASSQAFRPARIRRTAVKTYIVRHIMQNTAYENDERIARILQQIPEYPAGNFAVREQLSHKNDGLNAIIIGLNTPGKELQEKQFTNK